MMPKLILASTSRYRANLLRQLSLPFTQIDPQYVESRRHHEAPDALAQRLGREKAQAGAAQYAKSHASHGAQEELIIIGSDQVAHQGAEIYDKPLNLTTATSQLRASSGHWLKFSSSICLVNQYGEVLAEALDHYEIKFRQLSEADIQQYLKHEPAFDCAGSIKAEGLGISLISEGRGKDINTLYGLPLIVLVSLLKDLGYSTLNNIR